MSNRQARIARKQQQRDGDAAYVHLKPTTRVLAPVPRVPDANGTGLHRSRREEKRRRFRYEQQLSGRKAAA